MGRNPRLGCMWKTALQQSSIEKIQRIRFWGGFSFPKDSHLLNANEALNMIRCLVQMARKKAHANQMSIQAWFYTYLGLVPQILLFKTRLLHVKHPDRRHVFANIKFLCRWNLFLPNRLRTCFRNIWSIPKHTCTHSMMSTRRFSVGLHANLSQCLLPRKWLLRHPPWDKPQAPPGYAHAQDPDMRLRNNQGNYSREDPLVLVTGCMYIYIEYHNTKYNVYIYVIYHILYIIY